MIGHWTLPRLPAAGRLALATTLLAASMGTLAPSAMAASGPDLTLSISRSASSIPLAGTVDFTFTMKNQGNLPADPVRMDALIKDASGTLTIITQPFGQTPCTVSGNELTCQGLDFTAGLALTVAVRATASSSTPGTIEATAAIKSNKDDPDVNESNNSAVSDVTVFREPDLTATIVSGPDLVTGGADVHFKIKVQNLGGDASNIGLDFRSTGNLVYQSVDFVNDVRRGFTCDIHNPAVGQNYVSCSGGSLNDPNVTDKDESVTVDIGAQVKPRGLTAKDNTVTATVDPSNSIVESNEGNNVDKAAWHYD